MSNVLLIFVCALGLSACGVKGDPLPPMDPPELGRGSPSFKGATKGIDVYATPTINETEDDEKPKKKK